LLGFGPEWQLRARAQAPQARSSRSFRRDPRRGAERPRTGIRVLAHPGERLPEGIRRGAGGEPGAREARELPDVPGRAPRVDEGARERRTRARASRHRTPAPLDLELLALARDRRVPA